MFARHHRTQTEGFQDSRLAPIEKEFQRYEAFSLPPKNVNILQWWKSHENVLPLLSKLAKKVLTVPASSAKSERVFSCGGNFVTPKRNSLGAKKVEDLIVIKENKEQIKDFKAKSTYKLRKVEQCFDKISVDLILARLVIDEDDDPFEESDDNGNDAEVLFVNGESDVDSEVDSSSDIEEI